jgi:UrcA family protein
VQAAPSYRSREQVQRVNMSNIDTSTEIGAERLLRRIRDAAVRDCERHQVSGPKARRRQCVLASMTRLVVQTHSTLLTARFARNGESMITASED